ncbi:MAG: hypothetical protein M1819_004078 [Sarea resinae]|nr:MAG: hypothetical protein M1819_004078 [Sarea resinae]
MSLTPIRVRGKRKRKDDRIPQSPSQSSHSEERSLTVSLPPSTKTSRSNTPSSSTTTRTSRSQSSAPKRRRRQPRLSLLEQLPTELLHDIFFHALNLDLPLASPHLASRLSSEHLYIKLLLFAFPGRLEDVDWDLDEIYLRTDLQTRILQCKWMTRDLLRKCGQLYEERVARAQGRTTTGVYYDSGCYYDPGYYFDPEPELPYWPVCHVPVNDEEYYIRCCVPEKLLHGPWTDDKVTFLSILVQGGATVDLENTTASEVMLEGLEDAIREGRADTVGDLILLDDFDFASAPSLMRLAVLEAGCDRRIVQMLIYHFRSTIDAGDSMLWAWAAKNEDGSQNIGTWLREKLKEEMRVHQSRQSRKLASPSSNADVSAT